MSLARIARLALVLTVIVGGFHVATRLATHHRVKEGTLFALSEKRLASAHVPEAPVLLLIGDSGAASPELRANFEAMAREKALLVLHAGDIAYRGCFDDRLRSLGAGVLLAKQCGGKVLP